VRGKSNLARDTLRGKRASGTGCTGVRDNATVLIRPRADHDLPACAALVRAVHAVHAVHAADRYPRYLPADLGNFLAPPAAYGFWIAELSSNEAGGETGGGDEVTGNSASTEIAGHVALVARSMPAASTRSTVAPCCRARRSRHSNRGAQWGHAAAR
jgi:hypothetical protein